MKTKLINFLNNNEHCAFAFVRIFTGIMMIFHGFEVFDATKIQEYSQWDSIKSTHFPLFMAYLGKGSEFFIGIMLTFGLFTRFASFLLICTMLFITFKIGNGVFWFGDQHPFMFVLIGIIFLFLKENRFSLDNYFSKKN
jgi:putative oxidoreductase